MIKNKNVYFLSKKWGKSIQNLKEVDLDSFTEARHFRKGSYTPDIFRQYPEKKTMPSEKPKTARHLSKSDILDKSKSNNPFPEQKPMLQLFPQRKLYHNKYYSTSAKEQKASSSCHHQHIMDHVLEL